MCIRTRRNGCILDFRGVTTGCHGFVARCRVPSIRGDESWGRCFKLY